MQPLGGLVYCQARRRALAQVAQNLVLRSGYADGLGQVGANPLQSAGKDHERMQKNSKIPIAPSGD